MLEAFVLTYVEAFRVGRTFVMHTTRLSAADNLVFLAFQRDFTRWRRSREAN